VRRGGGRRTPKDVEAVEFERVCVMIFVEVLVVMVMVAVLV